MSIISRKNFLQITAMGAASVPFRGYSLQKQNTLTKTSADGQDSPVFRFVQINDLHIQNDRSRYVSASSNRVGPTYKGANDRAFWLLQSLKNDAFFNGIDFVLGIGDLVHGQQLEAIKYDLDFFATHFYKDFPVPLYPAIGNHEIVQREGDPVYEAPYKELFGKDKVNYSFLHKGVHFIVINNAGSHSVNDKEILNFRLASLERMLNEHPDKPKIVCCHIPLIPIRQNEVLAKSFGFSSYFTKETELLDLVEKYKVLAVLSGHLHISGMIIKNSVHHIAISGSASYPHDMALYTVYKDRIDAALFRVPSDLLVPSTNIHGAARFGLDYTDNLHQDYTTYIMGQMSERYFSIPLK
ncbi:MAG: metallophosphoesterase [Chitinophagaceae bacterium]|nr:metallophosphoesterase [Chitinophagaceae bacterium]